MVGINGEYQTMKPVRSRVLATALTAAALAATGVAAHAQTPAKAPVKAQPRIIAPLANGDEAIVVTTHTVQTVHGPLTYEARVGRLPIRNDESGEVRGWVGFTAYHVKSAKPRPLTFLWNGGPTGPSTLVHTEVFGPRRIDANNRFVDNAETLLATSDLVFYDPIGTGFSRAAYADYEKEFLTTLGDFAMTTEFIRAYRVKFGAENQPLFEGGESYGTWRANGTAEMLTKKGIHVSGVILISGGVPGSLMPGSFQDAMYVPARTATAFDLKKLDPDLMKDKAATMKAVDQWAYGTYMPSLERIDKLTPAEREKLRADLAHFTGVKPEQVNEKTLIMTNNEYKAGLFPGDKTKVLNTYDMRIVGPEPKEPGKNEAIAQYFRDELGYRTDIAYTGLEDGYMPVPGPNRRSTGSRWTYNHVELTKEAMDRMHSGGGPPLSQPWLQNAMRKDRDIKVYVAAGRYDSLNMCEGNVHMIEKLEPDLVKRFTSKCYEGGHMMYKVQSTRLQIAQDLARFIADASRPAVSAKN
jgi:carboxypeptidase C (cathepsin A)